MVGRLALAVEHGNIALVNHIAEYAQPGIPLPVARDCAFDVGGNAYKVALVLVECTRKVFGRILLGIVPAHVVKRWVSVVSVEVAHSVG